MKLNPLLKLAESLEGLPSDATRSGYGRGVIEAGKNKQVVVLSADLTESCKVDAFQKKYPDRFFLLGVAEQNMMGVAAGLSFTGKIPFVNSFAAFNPGRNFDQLRVSVVMSDANVKVYGGHAGVTVGEDGATHQMLVDLALTRSLPGLIVVIPSDAEEARKATLAIAQKEGPCYLRGGRLKVPTLTTKETPFELGKAEIFVEGTDVTIAACGVLVYEAVLAAQELEKQGISAEVINVHTLQPLDSAALVNSVKKTGCIVTAEEHQINGGLGSAVGEVLSEQHPVPLIRIGMKGFGQSGSGGELLAESGLKAINIVKTVEKLVKKVKS
ncbi:transketolase [Candidatus Woesearchaeota archaeon]|nr:transketolase [Candidatus Woesearchaeota archaeon]|tara:strand:- start:859 stop:1839 length:981 start_codon:yes stop_codon:yes gene_type:complete